MLKHNIILGKHEGVMKKSLDEKSVWVEQFSSVASQIHFYMIFQIF